MSVGRAKNPQAAGRTYHENVLRTRLAFQPCGSAKSTSKPPTRKSVVLATSQGMVV